MKNPPTQNIPIHIFHWGPCIIRFKISHKFHKDLLEHAYTSRHSSKDYRSKLAGHIKEEYAMGPAFLPESRCGISTHILGESFSLCLPCACEAEPRGTEP